MEHDHQQRRDRIRLIATDLDGTLLDSTSAIPIENRQALVRALARNVQIALVTARKRSSTFEVADDLGLPCACIAHNGARVWDWERRELRHLTVDLDLARDVARYADRHAVPLVLTIDEINYYSAAYPITSVANPETDRQVSSVEAILQAAPTRIIAAGPIGVRLLHEVHNTRNDTVVVHRYYSRDAALASAVLTHPLATKEAALQELLRGTDIRSSEVLALGDAEADAAMLRWAGIGVAMGNAMPEALAVADWIAPDHNHGGFVAALERFVFNGA